MNTTIVHFEVLGDDEQGRIGGVIGQGLDPVKALGILVGGIDFNAVIYARMQSSNEKVVYFVAGVTRQMLRWTHLAPSLSRTVQPSLAFFAHIWELDLEELHSIVITNHPW